MGMWPWMISDVHSCHPTLGNINHRSQYHQFWVSTTSNTLTLSQKPIGIDDLLNVDLPMNNSDFHSYMPSTRGYSFDNGERRNAADSDLGDLQRQRKRSKRWEIDGWGAQVTIGLVSHGPIFDDLGIFGVLFIYILGHPNYWITVKK